MALCIFMSVHLCASVCDCTFTCRFLFLELSRQGQVCSLWLDLGALFYSIQRKLLRFVRHFGIMDEASQG